MYSLMATLALAVSGGGAKVSLFVAVRIIQSVRLGGRERKIEKEREEEVEREKKFIRPSFSPAFEKGRERTGGLDLWREERGEFSDALAMIPLARKSHPPQKRDPPPPRVKAKRPPPLRPFPTTRRREREEERGPHISSPDFLLSLSLMAVVVGVAPAFCGHMSTGCYESDHV